MTKSLTSKKSQYANTTREYIHIIELGAESLTGNFLDSDHCLSYSKPTRHLSPSTENTDSNKLCKTSINTLDPVKGYGGGGRP